jgi:hypothetical protein
VDGIMAFEKRGYTLCFSNKKLVDDNGPRMVNDTILDVMDGLVEAGSVRTSLRVGVLGIKRNIKILNQI